MLAQGAYADINPWIQSDLYVLLGPGYIDGNKVQSPNGKGTPFDLANFSKYSNPVTSASIGWKTLLDERANTLAAAYGMGVDDREK